MKLNMDVVTAAYVETRNEIKALEDKISELEAFQAKKEEWFLQQLAQVGAESMKTKHGTVYTSIFESVTVAEPETFFQWVKENDAWECIEKRAAKTAVLQIMGEKENDSRPNSPPPGLSYMSMKKVGVRKS